MSANRKRHQSVNSTRHQEASQMDYNFNLEHDESFGFVFDQGQIRMDSEDHLENLFQSSIQAEDMLRVKEESVDINQFYDSCSPAPEPTLNDYYRSIKELQNKCRLVQQIILATATESIYQYPIDFKAKQQEEAQAKERPQSESQYIQPYDQVSLKLQFTMNDFQGEQSFFNFQQPRDRETVTVVTVLDTKNSLQATQQSIQLASNCCYNPPTSQEKVYFLQLLSKLQSLSRGIERKMIATYVKDHRCKVCGLQFETGRKLGGHISRKHPGNSYDYLMKKEIRRSKICERNRRKYLKNMQLGKSLNREQKS